MSKAKSNSEAPTATEMEVRWKKGSRFSESEIPCESVYQEICRIKDSSGGQVTAEMLVEYGQAHKRSLMFKLIGMDEGWNDAVAAHKYRVVKAGTILRSIEVKYSDEQKDPVRAFSIDTSSWSKKDSRYKPYRATEDILMDDAARADLLNRALSELTAFQRKYRALNELAILIREIDGFLDNIHKTLAAK